MVSAVAAEALSGGQAVPPALLTGPASGQDLPLLQSVRDWVQDAGFCSQLPTNCVTSRDSPSPVWNVRRLG